MKVTVKRGQLVFDLQLELDRTWKLLGSPPNEKLPAGAKFGKYSIVGGLGPVVPAARDEGPPGVRGLCGGAAAGQYQWAGASGTRGAW